MSQDAAVEVGGVRAPVVVEVVREGGRGRAVGGRAGSSAAPTTVGRVDTKKARRRLVAFDSLAEVSKDLDRIEAARAAGKLVRLGNHEAGPIFMHVGMAMKGSFDGFPTIGPWWLRVIGRVMKRRILSRPFQPGFNLREQDEKLAWDDSVSYEAGMRMLREQIARATLAKAGGVAPQPGSPHPFFGEMTPAEWQGYYLRHAELHLSFLRM